MEIFWNSEWRPVCSDGWDDLDAHVVCRQFHYLSTSIEVQRNTIHYSAQCHVDYLIKYS